MIRYAIYIISLVYDIINIWDIVDYIALEYNYYIWEWW